MRRSTALTDDGPVTFGTVRAIPVLTPDAARILLAILRSGESTDVAASANDFTEEAS